MDSFYASVEIAKNPSLRDKPLIIGADPKAGKGRGVVMTCNYYARKFGIKSAMPISSAYKLCPSAVYLKPNMPLYAETSYRIMSLLRNYGDKFEQVSIDEAFLDVSNKVKDFDASGKFAMKIKDEIKQKEKMTCSIGIGENKLIAKMASGINKPDGLTIIKLEDKEKFLEGLPVQKIPGVGPKTRSALEKIGINSIGDLRKYNLNQLVELFGQNYGHWLYEKSHGIDDSPVEESYEIKSINRNITFEEDTEDINLMHETIEEMARDVFESLQANNFSYKTVTLRVRYDNFDTFTRAKSLSNYSDSLEPIIEICKDLSKEFLGKRKIRQLGVRVSNLISKEDRQKSILEF